MKKKTILASSLATLTLFAFAGSALAWGGMGMGMKRDNESFQAIQEALSNKDYASWQDLINQDDRQALCAKFISEDEFASFAEQSLERINSRQQQRDAITKAITERDYETWKDLTNEHQGQGKFLDQVTAENFDKFAEAMELAQNGDFAAAKELRTELGLSFGRAMRKGQMRKAV